MYRRFLLLLLVVVVGSAWEGAAPGALDPAYACAPAVLVGVDIREQHGGDVTALTVTLTAQPAAVPGNRLSRVSFQQAANAILEVDGAARALPTTVTLAPPVAAWSFVLRRGPARDGFLASFVVTDACGEVQKLAGIGASAVAPAPTATPPGGHGSPVTFRPAPIGWDAPELANPGRGAYRWYERAPEPAGWPALDSYRRYNWREIEPTEGAYAWGLIDGPLAEAASRSGRFGLRIMPANSFDGGTSMPDYLMARMPGGFWFTYPENGKLVYAPDWNDPDYLDRAEALIRALAQRYANDPRFGWIEIGPYGDWSEWHVWQWPYSPSPTGATDMTRENRTRLIDLHVELFPPEKLVQMIDSGTGSNQTLGYALARSPKIGVRADCFGTGLLDTRMAELASAAPDRWKTAPLVVEYCGGGSGSGQFATGTVQVTTHHVSLVEGNRAAYAGLTAQERRDLDETRKRAGYRLRLASLTLPETLSRGAAFGISSQWVNDGAAPPYAAWDALVQLRRQDTGAVVWSARSALDVRSVLPSTSAIAVEDAFALPAGLSPGAYDVAVTVVDPGGYFSPLALAIQGRASDGSYRLGTVTVR